MKMLKGYDGNCFMCGTNENVTRHHVIPKVYNPKRNVTIPLCKNCHQTIHLINPKGKRKLNKDFLTSVEEGFVEKSPLLKGEIRVECTCCLKIFKVIGEEYQGSQISRKCPFCDTNRFVTVI